MRLLDKLAPNFATSCCKIEAIGKGAFMQQLVAQFGTASGNCPIAVGPLMPCYLLYTRSARRPLSYFFKSRFFTSAQLEAGSSPRSIRASCSSKSAICSGVNSTDPRNTSSKASSFNRVDGIKDLFGEFDAFCGQLAHGAVWSFKDKLSNAQGRTHIDPSPTPATALRMIQTEKT
jgi:hypothetical protein